MLPLLQILSQTIVCKVTTTESIELVHVCRHNVLQRLENILPSTPLGILYPLPFHHSEVLLWNRMVKSLTISDDFHSAVTSLQQVENVVAQVFRQYCEVRLVFL